MSHCEPARHYAGHPDKLSPELMLYGAAEDPEDLWMPVPLRPFCPPECEKIEAQHSGVLQNPEAGACTEPRSRRGDSRMARLPQNAKKNGLPAVVGSLIVLPR